MGLSDDIVLKMMVAPSDARIKYISERKKQLGISPNISFQNLIDETVDLLKSLSTD